MQSYATAVLRDQVHLRATPQRIAVLAALAAAKGHPDAESLFGTVSGRIPGISLDTVYRTLAALERAGAIRRVPTLSGRSRYDAVTAPHAHFICSACERVENRPEGAATAQTAVPIPADRPEEGVRREELHIGLCRACRPRSATRAGDGAIHEETR